MSEKSLLAGAAIRRLRRRESLTQAAMATRLSISPSYLNLIERNQRALSARVVMQLVEQFDFDPRSLRQDEAIGGIDGMQRRLADERFAEIDIDRDEIAEWLSAAPNAASAFVKLFDTAGALHTNSTDPLVTSRHAIERWRNHFADLDTAAEELADELRLSRGDIGVALAERLRERHQLSLRILPREVMPELLRRLDLHSRQLQLSEMLEPASRNFQIALQLALLERHDEIRNLAAGANFAEPAATRLLERHLAGYFAAALLMPYARFLRACDATGYDLKILQRRFGVSFEQVAHRLTTLQRVGQRGLPFFMARLDRAGQFSKRFAGASGAIFLDSENSCPLWAAHLAFERPGSLLSQPVTLEDASAGPRHWFTMAQTVEGTGSGGDAKFVVVLGLEARFADDLAQARDTNLRPEAAQRIGPGCSLCHRPACQQRSLPPRGAGLGFDDLSRGVTPFRFGENIPT
ncbi:helix-turn-helix domain-containing protein [Altererythrobacter aquiaggeris]|uniref:helix-turn-helix domain-containing protein n=1 Tax=Aestuarierythrobacter aquiaggeris TaxID=1898396 RepID=UPI0030169115